MFWMYISMLPFRKIKSTGFELYRIDRGLTPPGYVKIGDIDIVIEPSDTVLQIADTGIQKRFIGYVDIEADIRRGDKVKNGNDNYTVEAVNTYERGVVNHKEVILELVE